MNLEERNKRLREASGNVVYSDALTVFLYLLMRNDLPAGKVEELVLEAVSTSEDIQFTNGWLAQYASNLAEELMNAKSNNLAKVLSEAFGGGKKGQVTKDTRPSFKTEEQSLEERKNEGKKAIEVLVQTGQLKPEEATEIMKEIEDFEKE